MFAPCINSIKERFTIPTDAHYYKITAMLKTKFRQLLRHVSVHAGTFIRERKFLPLPCIARLHTGWNAAMTLTTSLTTSTIET
jgi:hypothetical protein